MLCSSLHHIEVCVRDADKTTELFQHSLGFTVIATRETKSCKQIVLKENNSMFVITERKKTNCKKFIAEDRVSNKLITESNQYNSEENWTVFCCQEGNYHKIDSVFNSALNVNDVTKITNRVRDKGGKIIKEPTVIRDSHGYIEYSIIGTPIGNAVHTLINKTKYDGMFLPGFNILEMDYKIDISKPNTTHIDHVAYVCEEGQSSEIIEWYEDVFGMKRFLLNNTEDQEEGFVLRENVGLRLKALEYWQCYETGLYCNNKNSGDISLKVVIGEPITAIEGNHVSLFLKHHGGPGVQHIALHTPSILDTVQAMKERGIDFRMPPPTYYNQGGKLEEMSLVGLGTIAPELQRAGLLLDTEADPNSENNNQCDENTKYLLQIFTKPIFDKPTFFLEIMHRAGAEGFGVGNITALARSIECQSRQDCKRD